MSITAIAGIFKFVEGVWAEVKSNIMDEGIEGIFTPLNKLLTNIADIINEVINSLKLRPSLETWKDYLGEDLIITITDGCALFGASIAVILLAFYILQYMVNPEKQRVTPLRTLGRLGVAAFFIYGAETIRTYFLIVMNYLFTLVLADDNTTINVGHLILMHFNENTSEISVFGYGLSSLLEPPLSSCSLILAIIISWQLIKQYFRCLLELIERYLILMIILFFMPAAAGTVVYEGTENIFKSYWRMVFGQVFLLIVGGLLLKGATYLVVEEIAARSFIGFIFTLGYLKTIQRVDSYLQAMGLNVANSVGGLAQSLAGGAMSLASGFNALRRGTGSTMQAFGAASGSRGMFKAGAILGANARDMAIIGLPTNSNIDKRFASMAGTVGNNEVAVSGGTSAKMLSAYMSNPRENAKAVGSLGQDSLNAGVSTLTGMDNVNSAALRPNGEIEFGYGDGNEAVLSHMDKGLGQPVFNADNEMIGFVNAENTLDKGDTINGSLDEITEQTGALGLMSHTDMTPEMASSISSATYDGNYVSYRDSNDRTVAMTDKRNNAYVPASGFERQPMSPAKQQEMLTLAQKNYPDWKITSREVKYDKTRDGHYVEMQKSGNSDKHNLYIQDGVSRNTFMVPKDNAMEYKTVRINRGTRHRERINMGFVKKPVRIEVPNDKQ